ncbi:hypothetical protein H5T58_00445 [Candidatus Parcubacteria bacterium]|nr:hypothetical protein [Candidatus Parcubacteria bacterium]
MGQSSGDSKESSPKVLLTEKRNFVLFGAKYQIEVVNEIEKCFLLWEEFSPKETIFDTWEFRFAFFKGYNFKPYFLVAKKVKKILRFCLFGLIKRKRFLPGLAQTGKKKIHFGERKLKL